MGLTRPRAQQIYDIDYKQAARVVTTTNIGLASTAPNQVDGVNLSLDDRVLVTGQVTASQNGIYYVTTVGSGANGTWSRATDSNQTGELLAGTIIMVTEGQVYADTQWKLITNNPIVIGTTALTFVQNYSANSISSGTSNVVVNSNANVTISAAGTANVFTVSNTGVYVSGVISATGNITGNYILGNGAFLSGLPATYSNANVANYLPVYSGNISAGNISVVGNIIALYYIGNGSQLSSITGGNVTGTVANATYALTANNSTYAGTVTTNAQPNITSVGLLNAVSVTGNISTTGNVTGAYYFGNGSQLTGIVSSYGNANVSNFLVNFGSNSISTSGNVTAGYIIGNGSALTTITGANITGTVANATYAISANSGTFAGTVTTNAQPNITSVGILTSLSSSGNITGGNLLTGGLISSTGNITSAANITGGNILFGSGVISGTGTIDAATISASANVTGGNILTAGVVSATGNVTGNYIIGNGSQLTGINTGIPTQIANGSSNISINSSGGNIEFAVANVSDTMIVSPGELTVYGVYSNPKTISSNVVITPNINSLLIGPVSLAAGINIYVPDSSTLNVV